MGVFDNIGKAAGSFVAGAATGWAESFAKAAEPRPDEGADRAPGGSQEDTVANAPVPTQKATDSPKSLFFDPWSVLEQLGYKERASPMSYAMLREVIQRTPVVATVINTRVKQVRAFAKPQSDRYDYGFRVRLRDRLERPTSAAKQHIEQQTSFLLRTGVTDNPRGRDSFSKFLEKFTRDSLRYDQATFETVPNRKGQPAEFYAVDAASMRLADAESLELDEDFDETTRYVQIYDGVVVNQYTQSELCFGVRNPDTNMQLYGYGTSELEMALSAITGLINSVDYNSRYFSQSSGARGILNLKGPIPDVRLDQFKMQFYSMLTGVQNAFRTPIVNADDMQWIPLQGMSNQDMEFSEWLNFQIKVFCSFYSMDPAEINFSYGNVGQSSPLSEESNRDKITESRERGLVPLLDFLASCINTHLIWPINEAFEFEFVGLNSATRDQVADLNQKRVQSYMTVDELRAEDDKPPLPDGKGAVILNSAYLQSLALTQQQQQTGGQQGASPQDAGQNPAGLDVDTIRQLISGQGGNTDGQPGVDDDSTQKVPGAPAAPKASVPQNAFSPDAAKSLVKSLPPLLINLDL